MTEKEKELARRDAIKTLRAALPRGSKIVVVYIKGYNSGSVAVKVLKCAEDGAWNFSHLVAQIIGERYNKRAGTVTISGSGMDKAFQIAYHLGRALYDDGYTFKYQWV